MTPVRELAVVLVLVSNPWCYPARTIVTAPSDGFKIIFPGPKDRLEQGDKGRVYGGHALPNRDYRVVEKDTLWVVSATDLRSTSLDAEGSLAIAKSRALSARGATLVSEERVKVGDHPCQNLRIKDPDSTIRIRHCYTPARFYELMIITREEEARLEEIDRFFGSFTISRVEEPPNN